jgi:hypothetical protein
LKTATCQNTLRGGHEAPSRQGPTAAVCAVAQGYDQNRSLEGAIARRAIALWGRYSTTRQNAVYQSTRKAEEELGQHSTRPNVMRWFRELRHYGFIVEVSPAHHGVNGHGRAPHYRLTEEWYLGKAPTRDFLSWDGTPFTEKRKRRASSFPAKNRIRGDHGDSTLVTTGTPLVPEIVSAAAESGDHGVSMSDDKGGDHGDSITSLTTPYADPNLLSAFDAMWTSPPVTIPLRGLRLQRLFQRPAKRPDKRAKATYLAAWHQIEQQGLRQPRSPRVTNAAQVVRLQSVGT